MAKHKYLPEVEGNIGEPPTAGVWHGYDRSILRAVSDGLDVSQSATTRGVSSVPDAWARPLLFQSALRPGSKHPLHDRVVQEWRGLLSLLALHPILHQNRVKIVPLSLKDVGGEFASALRRLVPAPIALEAGTPYGWTETLLIRYEDIPIGAFSPTTLVYTATDYARRLLGTTLSLKDEHGYLAPPAPKLQDELRYVGAWVQQLHDRLNGVGDPRNRILDTEAREGSTARPVVDGINRLLDDWLDELRATLKLRAGERIDAKDVEVEPEPIEVEGGAPLLDHYRVYAELLRPLRYSAAAAGVSNSDLLLGHTRNRSAHAHVVVVTPQLLARGGKIWRSRRLKDLGGDAAHAIDRYFAAESGDEVDQEKLKNYDAVWIRPEKYFLTDTLAVSSERTALLAPALQPLNGTAERHLLLPFKREILDFFSPTDIRELLRPEFKETESGVTFTFTLPVGSGSERIQKTYRHRNPGPGEGAVVSLAVPPVQLFPRYVSRQWRRYYVFQGNADRVVVRPVVGPGVHTEDRKHESPTTGAVARVVELRGDEPWPEALVFEAAERTVPGQARSGSAGLGLALVPRPAEPPGLAGEWRVGIDFGTSNTNVFRQNRAADTAERWRFAFDDYLWDVTAAPVAARNDTLREFFVPPTPVELPIPTTLRVFQDAKKSNLLLDYFIYFSSEYELPPNVYVDTKWEGRSKFFLESLAFLLLVEIGLRGIQRVEFAVSYPKAFSVERLMRYVGEWENVTRNMLEHPEHAVIFRRKQTADSSRPDIVGPETETEGVAAGEFFASAKTIEHPADRAMKQIAAVCLDVGGGTTDISIWLRNNIALDASVMLAGRQISRALQQNSRVLEVLFSHEATKALEDKRNEPTAFAARLNGVLRREESAVREHLIDHANNREVQWIRRVLAVEFGAIAFYTAALLGFLDRREQGAVAAELATRGITLHWGGNAAKLINWIDFGRHDEAGIASKMFNALLFNALKEMKIVVPPTSLAQKQSPGHKSEAAGGLVVMPAHRRRPEQHDASPSDYAMPDDGDLGMPDAGAGASEYDMPTGDGASGGPSRLGDTGFVCGENIELLDGDGTRAVTHLDEISERALFDRNRTKFKSTSLDRLKRFVEIVNHFGVRFGLFTDDSKIALDPRRQLQIADAVRAHFVEQERIREGQREIEPVFILEVKLLLDFLRNELR